MTHDEALEHERVHNREGARQKARRGPGKEPEHAPPRDDEDGHEHDLLHKHSGDDGLDQGYDSVLRDRSRQPTPQAQRCGEQILPRREDEVVTQNEPLPERGPEDEQGQSGDPRMREHAGEPKGRHGALSWHA